MGIGSWAGVFIAVGSNLSGRHLSGLRTLPQTGAQAVGQTIAQTGTRAGAQSGPQGRSLARPLASPRETLMEAIRRFDGPRTRAMKRARIYRSQAVGPGCQPPYSNTVFYAETDYAPLDLLDWLKSIENSMGRVPGLRWSARVIDLDIALYSDLRLDHPRLTIPHRSMRDRAFVLAPLKDLAPQLEIPGTSLTVSDALYRVWEDALRLEIEEDLVLDLSRDRST